MDRKRMTKWDEFGRADIIGCDMCRVFAEVNASDYVTLTLAFNRLAEFEDKIERGELIPLAELIELCRGGKK